MWFSADGFADLANRGQKSLKKLPSVAHSDARCTNVHPSAYGSSDPVTVASNRLAFPHERERRANMIEPKDLDGLLAEQAALHVTSTDTGAEMKAAGQRQDPVVGYWAAIQVLRPVDVRTASRNTDNATRSDLRS